MAVEIVLPKLGNTVEECIIRQWNKNVGDSVAVDEALCEVETDKTTMEVTATEAGVLRHVFYAAGDVVAVMSVIAIVAGADEAIDALVAKHEGASNADETVTAHAEHGAQGSQSPQEAAAALEDAAGSTQAQSSGDALVQRELDYTPRACAYLARINIQPAQCTRHFPISRVLKTSQSVVEEKDLRAFFDGMASISPGALEALIAQDKFLTITQGSGAGGRIMASDIAALESVARATQQGAQSSNFATGMGAAAEHARRPLISMRKIIAQRIMQSLQSTAQVTLNAQADARALRRARAHYKERALPISINDMLLYIVARVLKEHVWANSLLVGDAIIEYREVNMGCAVQTPKGLMVPCIANASDKNIEVLSAEMKSLATKCKDGSITPDELEGATFTLSNLGALGVQTFTPILNAPQTGILGVGGVDIRAVEIGEDEFVFRPCLHLSLTFDHRAYDGADGAVLLKAFADAIAAFDVEKS